MATPLKVLTALSASYGAAISGSTGLVVNEGGVTINNNGGLIVNSNGVTVNSGGANITGQLTANTGLVVSNGALQVSNGGISGSSTLQVGGAATFGNNVTIAGDLTVNGTTTTINSTTLTVDDINIVLAQGNTDDAIADGGGISLSGSTLKTLNWSNSTDSWTSSENFDLAGGKTYKLAGVDVLSRTAGTNIFGNSTTGQVQLSVAGGTSVSGSVFTRLQAPIVQLSGTFGTQVSNNFSVLGLTTLAGASTSYLTASSGVSASIIVFPDGTSLTSSTGLGGGGGGSGDATKSGINTEYASLRLVLSGTLNGNGHADVNITDAQAGKEFPTTALHSCSIDVMTDTDGTGWTNDLVSVRLEVSASKLYVKIDAPAAPNAGYRLIAVNEADFNLV